MYPFQLSLLQIYGHFRDMVVYPITHHSEHTVPTCYDYQNKLVSIRKSGLLKIFEPKVSRKDITLYVE